MIATRAVTLSVVLVVSAVAIAGPAAGADLVGLVGSAEDVEAESEESMGANVSAFMQASDADASHAVESGMFVAAYENGDNETRERVVLERTGELAERVAELEAEYRRLQEESDEMNEVAYQARMTRIAVQLDALYQAVNETEPRARQAGVDTSQLNEIRESASNMTGEEIAEIASEMAGVEPPRGPPEDVPGNGAGQGSNGQAGDAGNASDGSHGQADGTEQQSDGAGDEAGNAGGDDGQGADGSTPTETDDEDGDSSGPPADRGGTDGE